MHPAVACARVPATSTRSGWSPDRIALAGALLLLSALAWAALVRLDGHVMGPAAATGAWTLAMVAMMFPSFLPAVLSFRRVAPAWQVPLFVAGYTIVWGGVGVLVVLSEPLVMDIPIARERWLGGALVIAGAYELSRWKGACLDGCRSPVHFLMDHWRSGGAGALAMGAHHGLYCMGCCAGLMVALVALGMMNVLWMALVATVVLAQKVLPRGRVVAIVAGVLLIVVGVAAFAGLAPSLGGM